VRLTAYPTTFWGGLENRALGGAIYLGLTHTEKAQQVVEPDRPDIAI